MSKILLCVTGGVAAYKAIDLVSSMRKRGEEVRILMTESATRFVSPMSFSSVGAFPVYTNAFEVNDGMILHTTLSSWGNILIVAPMTANTAAKIANGIADNLVTMAALAFEGPKIGVPSMNVRMYENPITTENLSKLSKLGWHILEPATGHLADGEYGKGRYPDNEQILSEIDTVLGPNDYKDVNVLVTAGPTREPIDPVRYITNRSSGKMGYEIAKAAKIRGANVILISGPVALSVPYGVERKNVQTAEEMKNAVLERMDWADIIIMAAAVADYRPSAILNQKIKKHTNELDIHLVKTEDILEEVSKTRKLNQFVVGFAAETENLLENARYKMQSKKLDMIVANDVSHSNIGFDSDYNEVTILCGNDNVIHIGQNKKSYIAQNILDIIKSHRVKLT